MLSQALRGLFEGPVEVEVLTDFARADPLHPEEQPSVARAVDKRRREFAAGRSCARRALGRLGLPAPLALPALPDRRVAWPTGFTGSISHAAGMAAAVVAPLAQVESLGLDVESLGRVAPRLYEQIASDAEIDWIRDGGAAHEDRRATQLFSAKEAFYKAQYPLTETFLGFHDVRYEPLEAGFRMHVRADVPTLQARGGVFAGRLRVIGGHVFAGITFAR